MELHEIAQFIDGQLTGDGQINIDKLSPIEAITAGALVCADGADNLKRAEESNAVAIILKKGMSSNKPFIEVEHPFKAFIQLLNHFHPAPKFTPGIHPSSVIAEDVELGERVHIGANVVIEAGSQIGDDTVIMSNVVIGHNVTIGRETTIHPQVTIYTQCQLGNKVVIHANSVIGSDGFGYTFIDNQHMKIPHVGNVIIEDNVEIGANSVVDRATMAATKIGQGTKIDNLVQVAHSVELGKNNILCAFTGIAGSTKSGDNVIFAANVGVSDHVTIEDNVILGARTGVPPKKRLREGNVYLGNPARPKDKMIEQEMAATRLPMMRKSLKELQSKVKELEKTLGRVLIPSVEAKM